MVGALFNNIYKSSKPMKIFLDLVIFMISLGLIIFFIYRIGFQIGQNFAFSGIDFFEGHDNMVFLMGVSIGLSILLALSFCHGFTNGFQSVMIALIQ